MIRVSVITDGEDENKKEGPREAGRKKEVRGHMYSGNEGKRWREKEMR